MTSPSDPDAQTSTPLNGVVRGACPHDCPDTCAMLVTVQDGRAIRVAGDPDHPFTRGFLCTKVNRYVERTYHPDRLLYPMRRDRKSTRLNSSHMSISYAVFCLKKKKQKQECQ